MKQKIHHEWCDFLMPFTIFFFVVGSCMLRLFQPGSDGNETVKAITFHQLQYFDSSESDTDTFPARTSRKFGSARKARPVWNMTQDLVSVRPTVWGSILFGWKLILWTEAEKKSIVENWLESADLPGFVLVHGWGSSGSETNKSKRVNNIEPSSTRAQERWT